MRYVLVSLLLIIMGSCNQQATELSVENGYDSISVASEDFKTAINLAQNLIREATRLNGAPGAQIAVAVDGKICWSSNLGFADLQTKTVVNDHTIFRIASISKIMTAVAVGKLLENGQLDLDKPIVEYLPELPAHYAKVTLRHLVSHQSGVRHYYGADRSEKDEHYEDVTDAFPLFVNAPLLFSPGTRSEYSSYGWALVSAVIQRVSGKPFLQLMQDEVWLPSGMKNTFGEVPEERRGDVTHFYVRKANRNQWNEAPHQDLSYNWGGAGISSNANDFARLGKALLNGRLLKPETLEKMFEQQFTFAGDSTGFGIGFNSYRIGNEVIMGHGGLMPTARSYLFLFPKKKMVIAYTANSGMGNFSDENLMLVADFFSRKIATEESVSTDSSTIAGWSHSWPIEMETDADTYQPGTLSFLSNGKELSGQLVLGDFVSRKLDIVKFTNDSIWFACVLRSHTAWMVLRQQNGSLSGRSYFRKPLTHSLSKMLRSEFELRQFMAPKNIRGR